MSTSEGAHGTSGVQRVQVVPRDAAIAVTSPADLERELKFLIPDSRTAFVRAWVWAICRPEAKHPPARVVTVYYDTPDLTMLDEKVNSDYLKHKVRVRWYAALDGKPLNGPAYVEAKFRVGSRRHKVRIPTRVAAADLDRWPLTRPEWAGLLGPLREQIDIEADLMPVVRLQYVRERFIDPLTGGRVALDSDISLDAVNPLRLSPGRRGRLAVVVMEYKSQAMDMAPHLLRMLQTSGAKKASVSKYLAAYLHSTQAAL
jgi:hypothetical protein